MTILIQTTRLHRPHQRLLATAGVMCLLACWLPFANAIELKAAPANRPLKFGVLPMFSPVTLFDRFAPLRDYLSKRLQREVLLETAPSYAAFEQRTLTQQYDIVLTAPHFAVAAEQSGHYRLSVIPTNPLAAYLVVRNDSPIHQLDELRGKTIATPSIDAFISIIGKQYLHKHGLSQASVTYLDFNSHNAAYQSVLGKESQAALISNNIFNQAVAEAKPLRIIARTKNYPGVVCLTSVNLPDIMTNDIQNAFVTLSNDKQSADILKKLIYPGYMKPPADLLDELRTLTK